VRLPVEILVVPFALTVAAGCGYHEMSSFVRPNANALEAKRFFVAVHPDDDWKIGTMIANRLTVQGKRVSEGPIEERPEDAQVVVTYEDRWMWDITMYMLSLRVDFRDVHTYELLATAYSYRTSLYRKPPHSVVNEVITAAFAPRSR